MFIDGCLAAEAKEETDGSFSKWDGSIIKSFNYFSQKAFSGSEFEAGNIVWFAYIIGLEGVEQRGKQTLSIEDS